MVKCMAIVTPVIYHLNYCNLALSHRYDEFDELMFAPNNFMQGIFLMTVS